MQRKTEKKIWEGQAEDTALPSLYCSPFFLKRIVYLLANLPAASTADHDGANVMRVVALLYSLCTHWPPSGHIYMSTTCQKTEHPERLFENEMFFCSVFSFWLT